MSELRIRLDDRAIRKVLSDLPAKQIPFAIAVGVNRVARRAADAERAFLAVSFDNPTPFTLRGIGIQSATKAVPFARVFIKDAQDAYLRPFVVGGAHFLGGKQALLRPVNQGVNQYGNLPRSALARLKGRGDVFIGVVKTKNGLVSGVWQRSKAKAGRVKRGSKAQPKEFGGSLRLLIRWAAPQQVKPVLASFGQLGLAVAAKYWQVDFEAAMAQALASAR